MLLARLASTQSWFDRFRTALRALSVWLLLVSSLVTALTALPAHAQIGTGDCDEEPLSIAALFSPGNYFPLVPAGCGTDASGNAIPLSIQQIPDILLRAYGALTSLVLYFGVFYLIYAGILWIASGVDAAQKGKAKKAITTAVTSIVLVLSAHIIVNTIVIILGLGAYAEMSVADFFVP